MPEVELVTRLVARVRALLPQDWFGRAGEWFRRTTDAISRFTANQRLRPEDLAEESVTLGRRKLEGMANKDFAAALKDFAEAEQKKLDTELRRRSMESEVRRKEAEARLAELGVVEAELELLTKLKEIGVILRRDADGNLTVLPAPQNVDLLKVADERRRELTAGEANIDTK